jgi:hypothetical protein
MGECLLQSCICFVKKPLLQVASAEQIAGLCAKARQRDRTASCELHGPPQQQHGIMGHFLQAESLNVELTHSLDGQERV